MTGIALQRPFELPHFQFVTNMIPLVLWTSIEHETTIGD